MKRQKTEMRPLAPHLREGIATISRPWSSKRTPDSRERYCRAVASRIFFWARVMRSCADTREGSTRMTRSAAGVAASRLRMEEIASAGRSSFISKPRISVASMRASSLNCSGEKCTSSPNRLRASYWMGLPMPPALNWRGRVTMQRMARSAGSLMFPTLSPAVQACEREIERSCSPGARRA